MCITVSTSTAPPAAPFRAKTLRRCSCREREREGGGERKKEDGRKRGGERAPGKERAREQDRERESKSEKEKGIVTTKDRSKDFELRVCTQEVRVCTHVKR